MISAVAVSVTRPFAVTAGITVMFAVAVSVIAEGSAVVAGVTVTLAVTDLVAVLVAEVV